ncbi:MAG TPA: ROK family protein [Ktedonobacteraceae bacterium]|nr:ROK family protein [Ktedonobacteraceae bacterium]
MQNNDTPAVSTQQGLQENQLPLVIGVDLGGTQIRTAVLRGATLLSRISILTGANTQPDSVLPRMYEAIQEALDKADVSLGQIAGIGVAAPGPLDSNRGIVFSPPNLPGWDGIPLRDLLAERFQTSIYVDNDANVAGLGEYMFGAGQGSRNIVYMTVSTGIGGGVIADGKLLRGANGTAGELGHMTIDWHGERCTCGNIGCLEYIASGTSIARKANEAIQAGEGTELLTFARTMLQHSSTVADQSALPTHSYDPTTVELDISALEEEEDTLANALQQGDEEDLWVNARTVALAAEAGIPLARAIIQHAAEALGVGFVNIIHIFNPDMIIVGGGVTQMGPMLMEPALRVVQERAMKAPSEAVRIVQAQLGMNVGLVGAGALVYSQLQIT